MKIQIGCVVVELYLFYYLKTIIITKLQVSTVVEIIPILKIETFL